MRHIFLLIISAMIMGGCAPIQPTMTMTGPAPVTMPPITYIVPKDEGIIHQPGLIEDLVFMNTGKYGYGTEKDIYSKVLGTIHTSTYRSYAVDTLTSKLISKNTMTVERRLEYRSNKNFGSGRRYYVNFTDTPVNNGYKVTLLPVKMETYQAKELVNPMPVPEFDQGTLMRYLLATEIYYRFEVNSEYNSESVHANFIRVLQSRAFGDGERDPVTGKIFKQQFVLPYKDQEILFTEETYPYRNGSKAVMYLRIPATLTSPNTIDYGIILNDIKENLRKIVKS